MFERRKHQRREGRAAGATIGTKVGATIALGCTLALGALAPAHALKLPRLAMAGMAGRGQGASTTGTWGPVLNWINAVHLSLLSNGKVIMYDQAGQYRLYNPDTNELTSPTHPGYTAMCGGLCQMADGSLFVMGGGGPVIANALRYCSIYNPFTDTWVDLGNMNKTRWYGINIAMPNGNVLVTAGATVLKPTQMWQASGDPTQPANGSYRTFKNLIESVYWYPRCFVAPNGMIFDCAPDDDCSYYDLRGNGKLVPVATSNWGYRKKGTAVMYRPGKIILIAGSHTDGGEATDTCELIDLNDPHPTWRYTTSLHYSRKDSTAVILPDGKVLVLGGYGGSVSSPRLNPEMWDPDTEQWTVMSPHQIQRGYHSTSVLLPDGRVIGSGGNRLTAQIFSPPYLQAGDRPTLTAAPDVAVLGTTINLTTPDTDSISQVNLIRLGSTTHNPNFDQRFIPLTFTKKDDGSVDAQIPESQNVAVPGYYMLFLVNSDGIPAVAKFVRVAQPDFKAPDGLVTDIDSARSVQLDWNDNSAKETGFTITRSTDGLNFDIIGSVAPNVTNFRDYPVAADTHYYYRVYATNANGDQAFTNVAEATTPTLTVPLSPFKMKGLSQDGPQVLLTWTARDDLSYQYIIERSLTTSNFAEIGRADGGDRTFTDTSVALGTTYYYRLRATNPIGTSSPSGNTAVKVVGAAGSGNTISALLLGPRTVPSGLPSSGVVTLTNPAQGDETVLITSDRPEAQVLGSVIVPDGETQARFPITTSAVYTKLFATIGVSLNNTAMTAKLTLNPTVVSLAAFSPQSVFGGNPVTGTVTLSGPAPDAGLTISLVSNSPQLQVPATITAPGGATTVSFNATTSVLGANVTATVTATGNGVSKPATVYIKSYTVSAVTTAPKVLQGGTDIQVTVTLGYPAPAGSGGIVVNLSSTDPSLVIPATVTVPEGQSSVTFTANTTSVSLQVKPTLTAAIGASSKKAVLTINP